MISVAKMDTVSTAPPPAHLPPFESAARRDSTLARAFPLSRSEVADFINSTRNIVAPIQRVRQAIDWLGVSTSPRYQPRGDQTFCNVYACDACYLLGIYLPRVWWTQPALRTLENGARLRAIYDETVTELSTNALVDWLHQHGSGFGWRQINSIGDVQLAAMNGAVVLICGRRTQSDQHGHLTIALGGDQHAPLLQSQAGRTNVQADDLGDWWSEFADVTFWTARPSPVQDWLIDWGGRTLHQRSIGSPLAKFAERFLEPIILRLTADIDGSRFAATHSAVLAPPLIEALVAAEDRRFFTHGGYDARSIVRATFQMLLYRRPQGASTIEQQLVRTLTGRRQRTLLRKVTEIALAAWLARHMPKLEIAVVYLRVAYFGWRMNGVEQAGERLGIEIENCSLKEACDIVAALRYPLPRKATRDRALLWKRRSRYILGRMTKSKT